VIPLRETAGGVTLSIRVHPKAKKNGVTGIHGDALKLSLTAAPEDGRANDAAIALLAALLRLPRTSITITAGRTSRNKVIRIEGITAAELGRRIQSIIPKA